MKKLYGFKDAYKLVVATPLTATVLPIIDLCKSNQNSQKPQSF